MVHRVPLLTAITLVLLLPAVISCAGPVLDDILNTMQIDQRVPARTGDEHEVIERDKPVGQTFVTGESVVRLCRIAVIVPFWHEDWQPEETLVLTLWDSPGKKTALSEFSIPYERRQWSGAMLMFSVETDVRPNNEYYFELAVSGGDGKIVGPLLARGDYTGGRAYVGGEPRENDLWFETHVKKVADRDANYAEFFDNFDLDYPGMGKVKAAVQAKDWDRACSEFLTYIEARRDLLPDDLAEPRPDPTCDTREADLVADQKWPASDGSIVDLGPNWNYFASWPTLGGVGLTRTGLMKPLAFTYTKTGDEKYARAWNDMLIATFRNVPCPLKSGVITEEGRLRPLVPAGISGTLWDSISIAARLHHETFYNRFRKSPLFEPDVRMAWWANLADMVNTLERMDAGGNWTTQNTSSLFSFAQKYPEFKKSKAWFAQGFESLKANFMENMYADGPCREATVGYHCFSLGMFFDVLKRGREMGLDVPHDHLERLENAFEYTMYATQPDWTMPLWGDSNRPADACGLIKQGADYFGREDMLWVGTKGKEGRKPSRASVSFPIAGYFIMRSGWDPQARYLVTRNGYSNSHYHSDNLAVIVQAYGSDLLPDSGIYIYGTPECNQLTQTHQHSTIGVDGKNLAAGTGESKWCAHNGFDYYNGTSCGYVDLPEVKHQRIVLFVKPDYWVIADRVLGSGEHTASQTWRLAPGKAHLDGASGIARTANTSGGNIAVIPLRREECRQQLVDDLYAISWEEIGRSPAVRYDKTAPLPITYLTVLYPHPASRQLDAGAVEMACDEPSLRDAVMGVRVTRGNEVDLVALNESKRAVSLGSGKVSMAADAAVVRVNAKNGSIMSFCWLGGTRLAKDGKVLAESDAPVEALSVSYAGGVVKVDAEQPEKSLAIATMGATRAMVNEKQVNLPKGAASFRPFAK